MNLENLSVFAPNLADENSIEFGNVVRYVSKLLRIFNPNLEQRPETFLRDFQDSRVLCCD